ncbi:MAG: tetratricopeptide repeat protein, partial [Thiohalomonadales bacterium]
MKIMIKNTQLVALILVLLLFVACGGSEERKAKYISKAKAFVAEENYEKARLELKNALQIAPKDLEARYMLAEVSEELKDWQKAVANLKYIIEQDKNHTKARNKLGRFYYLGGNLKESREIGEEILRLDPNNVDGLTLRATLYSREDENEKALNDVLKALKIDPSNIEASALLASMYAKMGLTEKSEKIFLQAIQKHPKNIELRMMLANLYIREKNEKKALIILRQIVEIEPDQLVNRVRLASVLLGLNKPDDAESVLREMIARKPDELEPKFILFDFFLRQDKKQQAEKELLAFIKQEPEAYGLRIGLAKFYRAEGKNKKAKKVYQEIIEAAGLTNDGLQARVKLARILMMENKLQQAEDLLNVVLQENVNHNEALISRGQLALAKNDASGAVGDFRAALKGQPNSAEILQYLAKAHVLNKEYEQAIDNLQSALAIEQNNQSMHFELAKVFSLSGADDKAIQQYEKLLSLEPDNSNYRLALFSQLMNSKDFTKAKKLAKESKLLGKDSFLGYYFLGVIYQSEKQYSKSVKELKIALKKQPKSNKILTALVRSQLANKANRKAIAEIKAYIKGSPDDVVAYNLLAEVYLLD